MRIIPDKIEEPGSPFIFGKVAAVQQKVSPFPDRVVYDGECSDTLLKHILVYRFTTDMQHAGVGV